jgi:hypothetical protein
MPSVTAFQVLEWLGTGTLIVVAVAWFTVGQRQWVRWGIVLLVLEWFAGTALKHGPARALFWLSVLVAGLLVLNFFTLRSWRAPRRIVLFRGTPQGAAAWPSHAAADVETWTKQLAALGFEAPQDVWYEWRAAGTQRQSRLRLTKHHSEPVWACVYVNPSVRSTGRSLCSRLPDNHWLFTEERTSDRRMTGDRTATLVRGTPLDTFERLVQRHRQALADAGLRAEPPGDVVEEHAASRNAWIEGLIADGTAVSDGEDVVMSTAGLLRAVPRGLMAFVR